jgi:hypothetical protein
MVGLLFFLLPACAGVVVAQFDARDPGVRGGSVDAGQPLASRMGWRGF